MEDASGDNVNQAAAAVDHKREEEEKEQITSDKSHLDPR
jgi:hypothetical protein